jgi:hypothetical protein
MSDINLREGSVFWHLPVDGMAKQTDASIQPSLHSFVKTVRKNIIRKKKVIKTNV